MKRFIGLALAAVLLLSLLAGCANNETAYVPTGDGLTWDSDQIGPGNTKPQENEVKNITLTYYPGKSLNPLICTDFTNRALFSLMYQSLFIVDREYQVEPLLCKSYRISEDMKTYTFYLEEARFSDGSSLTVNDVVATLQAARESVVYGGRFTHITWIAASEDGGVTIGLDTPYENLPILLDIPILKQDQLQLEQPRGTGPYVLDTAGEKALLRRNDQWWCSAELTVDVPAISLNEATSASQIRDDFEFSGLNIVCADPGSDRYADYRCDYELWDCENNIFVYLACNLESKVFQIPEIRAALSTAVDRSSLAADHYRGFARSANLPASPQSPYYSQVLASKYEYDGGTAMKAAIEAVKLLPETEVTLLVNSDDSLRMRVARDVAEDLRSCGLNVVMKELGGQYYRNAVQYRDFDLHVGQTRLSANMDLSAFFYSTGALSYGRLDNVEMYTLCLEALANYGNYYSLHQSVMNDGRLCPLVFCSYAVYATRGLVTDLTPARDNIFYYSLGKTMENAQIKN